MISNSMLKNNLRPLFIVVVAVYVLLVTMYFTEGKPVFDETQSPESFWFVGTFALLVYLTINLYTQELFWSYLGGIFVYITLLYVCVGVG